MRSHSFRLEFASALLVTLATGCDTGPRPVTTCIAADPTLCFEAPDPVATHANGADGWDDAPGSGLTFIVDSVAIAEPHQGFDIDGVCRGEGDCIDNSLSRFGQLSNDQIRHGILGGEMLVLVEVAGIDEPYTGFDDAVTVKVYLGVDADEPVLPVNNFRIPQGAKTCCEFKAALGSMTGDGLGQARAKIPAHIKGGVIRSREPADILLPYLGWTRRTRISVRLAPDLRGLSEGILGGGMPMSLLARLENPYCRTEKPNDFCLEPRSESTMLDMFIRLFGPDVDLDGDGREMIEADGSGRVSLCVEADGRVVPPTDPSRPWTCALRPEIADGFSVGVRFSGVPARIVGLADAPVPESLLASFAGDDDEGGEDEDAP